MSKLAIREAVLVEGKYDKIKLSSFIDTLILTTDGFGIFKQPEKRALLSALANTRGLVVLTDSDRAGQFLRSKLRGLLPVKGVTHLYIPAIAGKEKRKVHPSKDGLLGVEGMSVMLLQHLFEQAGIVTSSAELPAHGPSPAGLQTKPITKFDFYSAGLSGGVCSAQKRANAAQMLGFPKNMSANAMIEAMNLLQIPLTRILTAQPKTIAGNAEGK